MRGSLENPLHRRGGAKRRRSLSAGVGIVPCSTTHPPQGLAALAPPKRGVIFIERGAAKRHEKLFYKGESMKSFNTLLLFAAIVLVSASLSPPTTLLAGPSSKHLIDPALMSATVADINKEPLDIVSGENWYEAPEWKKHRMREIPFLNGYIDDFSNHPLDVNGDGFVDIVACAWFSKRMAWYENPRRYDGELSNTLWKEHVIESNFNYELMLMVDVDGDGKAQEFLPNYGSSLKSPGGAGELSARENGFVMWSAGFLRRRVYMALERAM
jgi:hypothetical protein